MGAAASFESQRPEDASDIRDSNSVDVGLAEVVRLRKLLGHLANDNGFTAVVYDGSDLVLGLDEDDDFDRCVKEISHIRSCLRLATANSNRRARQYNTVFKFAAEDEAGSDSSSSSSESEDETTNQEQTPIQVNVTTDTNIKTTTTTTVSDTNNKEEQKEE